MPVAVDLPILSFVAGTGALLLAITGGGLGIGGTHIPPLAAGPRATLAFFGMVFIAASAGLLNPVVKYLNEQGLGGKQTNVATPSAPSAVPPDAIASAAPDVQQSSIPPADLPSSGASDVTSGSKASELPKEPAAVGEDVLAESNFPDDELFEELEQAPQRQQSWPIWYENSCQRAVVLYLYFREDSGEWVVRRWDLAAGFANYLGNPDHSSGLATTDNTAVYLRIEFPGGIL